jgi:hypothetical protein
MKYWYSLVQILLDLLRGGACSVDACIQCHSTCKQGLSERKLWNMPNIIYYHVSSMCSNVFHMILLLPTIQLLESSYNQYLATLVHDVMQSMSAAASKQRNKG